MKKAIFGASLAALVLAGPAISAEKKKTMNEGSNAASSQDSAVGRGGLAQWPVSESPADWSSAAPSSASTGSSSGASGSSSGSSDSEAAQSKE